MNAFEDIVKLCLEEDGYWVRQSVKVRRITKEDKRKLHNSSMPTPEVDIVAYNAKSNQLLLVEVKSFLDSPGVHYEGVAGIDKKDAERYKLFTHDLLRQIITNRLIEEYLQLGLINERTKIKYALAAGHIYSTRKSDDEPKIRDYFEKKGWRLFPPKQIRDKVMELTGKGWEDNLITVTAKLTKEAITDTQRQTS